LLVRGGYIAQGMEQGMNDSAVLEKAALFSGTSATEIESMLGCLGTRTRSYDAGEYVFHMGDKTNSVGLVLEGRVEIENVDVWGNVSVIDTCGAGQLFCEEYAAIPDEPLMVDVVALEKTRIMFLTAGKVLTTCPHACPHHSRTSLNLTTMIARKNLSLSRQIFHAAPKSIRGKLLSYLSYEANMVGSDEFDIPFNRQQLADYLGVDRSALSNELSKMQKEGIVETKRSHFKLKAK